MPLKLQGKSREGGSELQCVCPGCGHEKLFVSLRKRAGICFRCGATFGPRDLGAAVSSFEKEVLRLSRIPVLTSAWEVPDARAYLRWRGVVDDPGACFDAEMRRIYFRIVSPSSEYQPSYHTRGIDEKTGWQVFPGTHKQHYIFNAWTSENRNPCIVVEGIFDALALSGYGMSLLGSKMSGTHRTLLRKVRRIVPLYVWFDPDEAGAWGQADICATVGALPITHDKEPADCSPQEISEVLRRHVVL